MIESVRELDTRMSGAPAGTRNIREFPFQAGTPRRGGQKLQAPARRNDRLSGRFQDRCRRVRLREAGSQAVDRKGGPPSPPWGDWPESESACSIVTQWLKFERSQVSRLSSQRSKKQHQS